MGVGVGGFVTIEECIVVEQVEQGLGMAWHEKREEFYFANKS